MNISNGKIYKGNSSSYSDVLANINGQKISKGNSTSYSDVEFHIDGDVTHFG